MERSITVRYFLFPPDGGLSRLSRRVIDGLVHGTDRLPQYAGQRLRVALATVHLADGLPQRLGRVSGDWWEFDQHGSIHETKFEALRDALNSVDVNVPTPDQDPAIVSAIPHISRRRSKQRWSWEPTPTDITAIVHAIWPETAGRQVDPPRYERGVGGYDGMWVTA